MLLLTFIFSLSLQTLTGTVTKTKTKTKTMTKTMTKTKTKTNIMRTSSDCSARGPAQSSLVTDTMFVPQTH